MNKQEALKRIEAQKETIIELTGWAVFRYIGALIEQLDEPQPVKVPKFVADWYEKKKHDLDYYIWDYIYNWNHQEESEFKRWMDCSITSFQTLVNMHQFGYEVEEEKRYRISMPKARNHKNHAQILCEKDGKIFWCGEWYPFRAKFTRKELEEANFGWVFDCEGIEIEEVNE